VSDEPEYLRLLKQTGKARVAPTAAKGKRRKGGLNPQEEEALRWARELAKGAELRSVRNLAGAKYAALLRIQGASGIHFLSVEGFASRELLIDRLRPSAMVGEEVQGAYEVRGGRPITLENDEKGQIVLKMGPPRPGANPVSPEKMIRRAAVEAAKREKERPRDRDGRGGGRGR
jgi:hypothetical protein